MEIKDKHRSKTEKKQQTTKNLWSKSDIKEHDETWNKETEEKVILGSLLQDTLHGFDSLIVPNLPQVLYEYLYIPQG